MEKLDLAKKYKAYYTAKPKPEIVDIEKARFLSIAGKGDPNEAAFATSVQALYTTAYGVKFACKAKGNDFVVAKLEGLWWFDEKQYANVSMEDAPVKIPRSEWNFRLLIRLPVFVTKSQVDAAIQNAVDKKEIALASQVHLFEHTEGRCVQMLHKGPFSKEPETLSIMLKFIAEGRFQKNGFHHEIYLSDFRKTPPEKLRTILREPVK